ncbi:LETM1 domain-containing protein 1 isoform X1 [Lampetra fluviatilis]
MAAHAARSALRRGGCCCRCSPRRLLPLLLVSSPGPRCPRLPSRPGFSVPSRSITSADKDLASAVMSKTKKANTRYEDFLLRNFPNFYKLYSTFMRGFRLLMVDAKEVFLIKRKLSSQGFGYENLTYRDMDKLREFRRDIIKAIPLVLLSIPPFANYAVFALMYIYPRQFLIRQFWSEQQEREFLQVYHDLRAASYAHVIPLLLTQAQELPDTYKQRTLLEICHKVQTNGQPSVNELRSVQALFSEPPLDIWSLKANQLRTLSRVMALTARVPAPWLRRRLLSHATEIGHLDRALLRMGPQQLTDDEVRKACYVRGLNPYTLGIQACRQWLQEWLLLSASLSDCEVSLRIFATVLLSENYRRHSISYWSIPVDPPARRGQA